MRFPATIMEGASRVAVTGGSGFMGTNLVAALLDVGASVLNLDVRKPLNSGHLPHWRHLDIRDRSALKEALVEFVPSAVIHLAARTDLEGREAVDYSVNVDGAESLIAAIDEVASVSRIVFCSSRMVCRIGYEPKSPEEYCPENAYGASKAEMERIIRCGQIRPVWTIVRPTSIWGPWFGVPYRTFFLSVARGRYVHPRGRAIPKSFGYVGNTVYQFLQLLSAPAEAIDGRLFYLADYEPIEVGDWARRIARASGGGRVREVPLALLKPIAIAGDMAEAAGVKNPQLTSFRLRNLLTPMVHDLRSIQELAPDLPYGLDEAVAITVDWLLATGAIRRASLLVPEPDGVRLP